MNERSMKPLKELNLMDRFLFNEVMEDPQTQQAVLSIIFEKDISVLSKPETEKEMRVSPLLRTIRLDLYTMDEEHKIYNTEMQKTRKADLQKRSRYYQGQIDVGLLEPGVPDYNQLNDTCLIMIMPFDLFGYGKYQYTFLPRCVEVPELTLEDGTMRIFLNTRGENPEEVSEELVKFLQYVEDTRDEVAERSASPRIRQIQERVHKVKTNEKAGVRYMQAWEEKYYDRQEAHEEGLAIGLEKGREEGLEEGLEKGREEGLEKGREEGMEKGREELLTAMVEKKLKKGKPVEVIAEELEESIEKVESIISKL